MLREQTTAVAAAAAVIERKIKFPKTVAAVQDWEEAHGRGENGLWKIGDALLFECGLPGKHGVNTGVINLLKKASAELRPRFGKRYHWKYLKQLRSVAARFPEDVRTASWSACCYAGDPETLQAAQNKALNEGEDFDVDYIRKYKARLAREKRKRERQREPEYVTARDEFIRAAHELVTRANAYKKRFEANRTLIPPAEFAASKKKFDKVRDELNAVIVIIEQLFRLDRKAVA